MAQAAAPTLEESLSWLDALEAAPAAHASGAWPLASVLDHLAQGVEMSLDGFPQSRSALLRLTLGRAVFALFKRKGRMQHGLDAAIPGAPPLRTGDDWRPAAQRLRTAITRFQQHQGALQPHFAYGALSKDDFALAHAMHIANHRDEITVQGR